MNNRLLLVTPRAYSALSNFTASVAVSEAVRFLASSNLCYDTYSTRPNEDFHIFVLRARTRIDRSVVIIANAEDGPYGPNDRGLPDLSDNVYPPVEDLLLGITGDLVRLSID